MPVIKYIPLEEFGVSGLPENDELKRLRYKNPVWEEQSPEWNFFLDAYEGGKAFAKEENLFRHARENQQDFGDRVQRIHPQNYCAPLIDFYVNFIYGEAIDRHGGANHDFYQQFIQDVSLRGETIDDFMRQVCEDMQIFGMSYVLVDSPPLPESVDPGTIITKADEQGLGMRPYWVLIRPEEITDWVVNDFGKFLYVKRVQVVTKVDVASVSIYERYSEFYPDKVVITDVDVTDKDKPQVLPSRPFPNQLGVIPLVVARFKRSKRNPHIGISFLNDFAYNNREIMNLTSLLQEFLYRQAFNILAKEVEAAIPLKEQEDGVVGTANVMEYPKGAKPPVYISPPADPARFIQDERGRIKNEMFLRASQDTLNEIFNGEKSSGFSQAQSFSKTVPFISSRADVMEGVENLLMLLTMQRVGKEWDGKVRYKDRYEITNLTDALTQLKVLARDFQLPSEAFIKEQLKRMCREYDGKLQPEVMNQVEKQIDDMDFTGWLETQKLALIGKTGTSPAAQQEPKSTGTLAEASQEAKVNTAATVKTQQ